MVSWIRKDWSQSPNSGPNSIASSSVRRLPSTSGVISVPVSYTHLVAVLLRGELGGFQIVVFFVHGVPPLSFLMVFMAPLLAWLLRGFLPSGSFFEPGGNGWAHPVRIAPVSYTHLDVYKRQGR